MKKFTFTLTLASYERKNNSKNGNPRYSGTFANEDGDTVLSGTTGTDCACSYNFLNKQDKPRKIEYHITRTGNVIIDDIEIVE